MTARVGIVTGASRGLGLALARALGRAGYRLVIDARDPAALEEARRQLGENTEVASIPGDVTDVDHRRALVAAARELGGLDLLVNNASTLGPSPLPPLASYPIDALRHVLEVNAVAPLALLQEALPLLRDSGGVVVNITSDAGVEGYEGWGGYGASKAALEQLSNVLAAEEAGVRVLWVDPGDMATQMHQEAYPGQDISDRPPPDDSVPGLIALIEGAHPPGRYRATDVLSKGAAPR